MKRIAVSAGLVALGATFVQAGPSAGLSSMEASKAWSIGASLRGWYDDNYLLAPKNEEDSWGFTLAPTVSVNLPLDQTLLTASYTYSWIYYEASDESDQMHQFDMTLVHSFSERYMLEVRDSFVVSQEPTIVDGGATGRSNQDAIRNTGSARLNVELTRLVSLVIGYGNNYVNYCDDDGNYLIPSYSATLDRIENLANIDVRWQVARQTVGVIGYQFGAVNYTGDEDIATNAFDGFVYESDDRNNYSHYLYGGVDHNFNPQFSTSVRLGVQYTDYYNNEPSSTDSWSPYAEARLTYEYSAKGSAQLGVRHSRNATDVVEPDSDGEITMDQQSTSIFGNIGHQLTPKLRGTVSGSLQFSEFNGGSADHDLDTFYSLGVNLTYSFNQHLSAECGYMFDGLDSDVSDRGYDRNRVYIGLTAAY